MTVAPEPFEDRPTTGGGVSVVSRIGTGRIGSVFALVWLIYLWQPLQDAWGAQPTGVAVAGVAGLLAFGVVWAGWFVWWRARRINHHPVPARLVWVFLAVEVALLMLAVPAVHQDVLAGALYLGVAAVMTLPARQGSLVVFTLVATSVLLPRLLPGWTTTDELVPELLLGCLAAYGVSQILARNGELARAREQLVELAVSQERERLARDVHDILGHSLTVITVKAELVGRLLEDSGPEHQRTRREVADLEELARAALADVRATVAGTREISLAGELASARQALAAAGIEADLPVSIEDVPLRSRELFAWTLREAVTNVVRHSAARHCTVTLGAEALQVIDDGRGGGTGPGGTGLRGLCARAEAADAQVESGPLPHGGFRLRVSAP